MSDVATKERPAKARAAEMKLTLDRADFLRALGHAAAIVERGNTIPILSHVLLDASDDRLKLTSTNLDQQVALSIPATIEAEGRRTVSASLLHGIVREMSDGSQVELSLSDNRLHVRSGRSVYKLSTLSADDFPQMQLEQTRSTFVLPAGDLLRCLKRIEWAQSSEETRPYLCGIHVETLDGKLTFAATEGNSLAFASLPAPTGADIASAILPRKLIATLIKLLDGHEGDVRLFIEDRKATAEIGSAVVTSKLVEGSFPNWRRVLRPEGAGKSLLIAADVLERAIRRVVIVAAEKTRAVKFELSQDKLTASCTSPEYGFATEEAPCVWDGGELTVGFNSQRLLEAVRASGADELQVDLIDAAAPPLFSNPADASAKFIVMPMRV